MNENIVIKENNGTTYTIKYRHHDVTDWDRNYICIGIEYETNDDKKESFHVIYYQPDDKFYMLWWYFSYVRDYGNPSNSIKDPDYCGGRICFYDKPEDLRLATLASPVNITNYYRKLDILNYIITNYSDKLYRLIKNVIAENLLN